MNCWSRSVAGTEEPAYNKTVERVVRVFASFQEADAADTLSRAQMTPQQRAAIFFELRERAHPDAFKQRLARVYRVLELERS
jgi:flagellar motility protein MotE (MotC chaperone)